MAAARAGLKELEDAWHRGQAAVLARTLADEAACPVCGSVHHPNPALSSHAVPTDADVANRRQSVERLEFQLLELREKGAEASGRLGEWVATVKTSEENLGAAASADVDSLRHAVAEVKANLERAEAAGLELTAVNRRLEQLRPQLELAEARLAEAEGAKAKVEAEFERSRAVVAEREAGVPESVREGQALDQAVAAARRRLVALTDAFEAARLAVQAAEVEGAKAQAALTAAEETAAAAVGRVEEAAASFAQRLVGAGFEDDAAYHAAKLPPRDVEQLDREIQRFRIDLHGARGRLERAASAADGLASPDLSALQAASQAADAALEANVRQEESLAQQLRQATEALGRLQKLEAELQSLDARYQVVGQVAEVAGGKNEYRMTFQRYVLGVFLDEVLYAATQRLKIMSRGRFLLQRVKDPATGRSAGGLDLEVHDHHTSTTRPVATLSGGESFLASLSLALGLADVVQAYAGGIRLETIFIDEGFGSLDPEALDLAIQALKDLQQGGRLVGIISHVSELKEWIDARLEVLPGRRGSAARFVVA